MKTVAGAAVARQAFGLAVALLGREGAGAGWLPGRAWPGAVRVLSGDAGQVGVARSFVRDVLIGHPARPDAVAAVSELAANAVVHSASGTGRGRFVVQAFALGAGHAGLIVTDQGGPSVPPFPAVVDLNAVSGRGLVVVRSLSCWFRVHDHPGGCRSFAAAIPGMCGTDLACGPTDWIELGW
jgi:serine/threonine-protein kinase RsbW